jgi:putative transposase
MATPNEVWSADCRGQLKTGDGLYGYPLTVAEGNRRLLLGCHALASIRVAEAKPVFTHLFNEFGWPKRIRTDQGVPSATNTLGRLAHLSAWWVHLGILPECIEPGTPRQNGRHERRHRTLKAEPTRPPARSRRAQQLTCDGFRAECNYQRPHEALDMPSPGLARRPLAPSEAQQMATACIPRPLRGARRQRQWWHPVEPSLGQRVTYLQRRICRPRRH